jgi:3-hydroxyisobutyrate dehydrogenase
MTSVAVLGTGIMGLPMAKRLVGAGFEVRVWNRTAEKARALGEAGATVAATPAEAAAGADVLLTMLADGPTVAAVVEQVEGAEALPPVWIQASTVGVEQTGRLAALAGRLGMTFVDAPVLGTRQPAEQGALVVLAAGPEAVRDSCAPVFDAIGSRTRWVGVEPGAASRLKLVVNSWVLALTAATAEALALAGALDLDPKLFLDTIAGTGTDSPYAHVKGAAMIAGEYSPAFPLNLAAKDAQLVVEAAEAAGVPLPVVAAIRAQLDRAEKLGHGADDMAAIFTAYQGN